MNIGGQCRGTYIYVYLDIYIYIYIYIYICISRYIYIYMYTAAGVPCYPHPWSTTVVAPPADRVRFCPGALACA